MPLIILASLFIGCGQPCLRQKGPLINGGEDYPDRELGDAQSLCLELLPGETLAWWHDASQRFRLGPARADRTIVVIDSVLVSTVSFSGTENVEDSSGLFAVEDNIGLDTQEEGAGLLLELAGIDVVAQLSFSTLLAFLDEYTTRTGLAISGLDSDTTYLDLLEELLAIGLIDEAEFRRLLVSLQAEGLDTGATIESLGLLVDFSELMLSVNAGVLVQYIQRHDLDIAFDDEGLTALHLAFATEADITLNELTSALNNHSLMQANELAGIRSEITEQGLIRDSDDQSLRTSISDGATLVLNKSASRCHIGHGGKYQYRIRIRNAGTDEITNIQVFDCLPRGVMLHGNDKNWRQPRLRVLPGSASDCLVWAIDKVDAGEELDLTFTVKVCK